MEENKKGRQDLEAWQKEIQQNIYLIDSDFQHSVAFHGLAKIGKELSAFGEKVVRELEPLVAENHHAQNLPRIDHYNRIGQQIETVVHHPSC
jgi:hypothetical protein